MNEKKKQWLKLFFGIIATIILGAIGSGFWELFLKPFCLSSSNLLTSIISSNLASYDAGLFKDVAKGHHEAYSLNLHAFFYLFVVIYVFDTMLHYFKTRKEILRGKPESADKVIDDVIKNYTEILKENNNDILAAGKAWRQQKEKTESLIDFVLWFYPVLSYCFVLFFVFVLLFTSLATARNTSVNYYITKYYQLSRIVRPYITEKEEKLFHSEFSQIQNSNEYNGLVKKMYEVCKKNNLRIPTE